VDHSIGTRGVAGWENAGGCPFPLVHHGSPGILPLRNLWRRKISPWGRVWV